MLLYIFSNSSSLYILVVSASPVSPSFGTNYASTKTYMTVEDAIEDFLLMMSSYFYTRGMIGELSADEEPVLRTSLHFEI